MFDRIAILWRHHPRLCAWLALSVGMVAVYAWAARGLGFTPGQWVGMAASCVALAGVCIWIIYWEANHRGEHRDG